MNLYLWWDSNPHINTAKERPSIGDITPGLSITYLLIYCKKRAKQYQQVEKIAKSFYLSKI